MSKKNPAPKVNSAPDFYSVGRSLASLSTKTEVSTVKLSGSLKDFERANTEVIAGRIFAVKRGGLTNGQK